MRFMLKLKAGSFSASSSSAIANLRTATKRLLARGIWNATAVANNVTRRRTIMLFIFAVMVLRFEKGGGVREEIGVSKWREHNSVSKARSRAGGKGASGTALAGVIV